MGLSKQEKLGIVNFILTVIAIILIKYLTIYVSWLPTAADGSVELASLAIITILAVLVIHAATWVVLSRYFNINAQPNSKKMLAVYEILFLISLAVLYIGSAYDYLPEFINENLLTGIGLFIISQMALSMFFTYIISKIPSN
jgi:hypothetical protein